MNDTALTPVEPLASNAPAGAAESPVRPARAEPSGSGEPTVDAVNSEQPARAGFVSLRVAALTCALLAVLVIVYFTRSLLFPVLCAILLSLLLAPAVAGLKRLKVPESLGAALVVLLTLILLGGLAQQLYEPATRWASTGPSEIASLQEKLKKLLQPVQSLVGATDKMAAIGEAPNVDKPREVVIARPSMWKSLGDAQVLVAGVMATVILLYFLLASGDLFLRKLIRVVPGFSDKKRAVTIARDIQTELGRYFMMITAINVGLGIAAGLTMMWLEMPTPLLIGAAVTMLNFVPYIGPAIALIGVTVLAAITFNDIAFILYPPAVLLGLVILEGQLLQPIVLGKRLALNPVALFLWMLLWGWLWGVAGLLIAVPLLVMLRVIAERVEGLAVLNEFLADK